MRVLFCTAPSAPGRPDRAFAHEVDAADAAGLVWSHLDMAALAAGDLVRALRRVDELAAPAVALYRGHKLRASTYATLHDHLLARGWRLISDPGTYRRTHLLQHALPLLGADAPRTAVVPLGPAFGWPAIHAALAPLGHQPVVLRDCGRTGERAWDEACRIDAADDRAEVERIAGDFIERQGEDLVGGLVFRAWEPLVCAGLHPDTGAPLPRRWRRFVADGRVIAEAPVWDLADPGAPPPALDALVRRVPARFFTLDLVERSAGGWTALELDDAQVSCLPVRLDARRFYRALAAWDPAPERPDRGARQVAPRREPDPVAPRHAPRA